MSCAGDFVVLDCETIEARRQWWRHVDSGFRVGC